MPCHFRPYIACSHGVALRSIFRCSVESTSSDSQPIEIIFSPRDSYNSALPNVQRATRNSLGIVESNAYISIGIRFIYFIGIPLSQEVIKTARVYNTTTRTIRVHQFFYRSFFLIIISIIYDYISEK